MTSKIEKLRQIDAEIVSHVIDRGRLWEKRRKIVEALQGNPELATYHAELSEWFSEIGTTPIAER